MKHLEEQNLSYLSHMKVALRFGFRFAFWTAGVFIHAFIPNLFTDVSEKMRQEIEELEK